MFASRKGTGPPVTPSHAESPAPDYGPSRSSRSAKRPVDPRAKSPYNVMWTAKKPKEFTSVLQQSVQDESRNAREYFYTWSRVSSDAKHGPSTSGPNRHGLDGESRHRRDVSESSASASRRRYDRDQRRWHKAHGDDSMRSTRSSDDSAEILVYDSHGRVVGTTAASIKRVVSDHHFADAAPDDALYASKSAEHLLADSTDLFGAHGSDGSSSGAATDAFGAPLTGLAKQEAAARIERQRKGWIVRHSLLLLGSLLLIGNYYAYDTPGATQYALHEWLGSDHASFQYQLSILYSVYSVPNIILPLLGGYLIRRVGHRLVLLTCSLLLCIGQTIFALGVSHKHFGVMIAGRVVFGIGGETLGVAQTTVITNWFHGYGLGTALSFTVTVAGLGTFLNYTISPRLAAESEDGIVMAMWVGLLFNCMCLLSAFAIFYIDSHYQPADFEEPVDDEAGWDPAGTAAGVEQDGPVKDRNGHVLADVEITPTDSAVARDDADTSGDALKTALMSDQRTDEPPVDSAAAAEEPRGRHEVDEAEDRPKTSANADGTSDDEDEEDGHEHSALLSPKQSAINTTASTHVPPSSSQPLTHPSERPDSSSVEHVQTHAPFPKAVSWSAALASCTSCLAGFSLPFWLLILLCFLQYASMGPFSNVASSFVQDKWYPDDPVRAGQVVSVTNLVTSPAVLLFGYIMDRIGRRATMQVIASCIVCAMHLTLGFTDFTPWLPLTMLGLSYGLFAAGVWPSIPRVVPRARVGMAYGTATATMNAALAVVPFVVAPVRAHLADSMMELLFACIGACSMAVGGCLIYVDSRHGGVLQRR